MIAATHVFEQQRKVFNENLNFFSDAKVIPVSVSVRKHV
jgi:hypothetical protein